MRPLAQDYGQLPMSFEPNVGQTDSQVAFLSQGSGYSLFLTPTESVLSLQTPAGTRARRRRRSGHDRIPC